jgi:hypothetical protein
MLVGVLHLHSLVRWVVTIATVALLVYLVYAMTRGDESLKRPKLVTYWTILFDIQGLLGIILLFGLGLARHRIEHATLMIIAIVVAHLTARWKNAPVATWARNSLIVVVIALLLVIVGVAMLPQGWMGSVAG